MAVRAYKAVRKIQKSNRRRPARRRNVRKMVSGPQKEIFSRANGIITKSNTLKANKVPIHLIGPLKTKSVDIYKQSSQNTMICEYGLQSITKFAPWGSGSEIAAVYNKSIDINIPYAASHTIGSNSLVKKIFIESVSTKTMYVNQGPSMIKVFFYDLISKRQGTQSDLYADPEASWLEGLQDAGGVVPVEEVPTYVGSQPRDSKLFMQEWEIVKKHTVYMATGAAHEHTFTHATNAIPDMSMATTTGGGGMRRWFQCTMVVIHGLPCDDSSSFTDSQTVSTDRAKLIAVTNLTVKSRILDSKGKHVDYFKGIGNLTAGVNQNPDGIGIHNTTTNLTSTGVAWG